MESIHSWTARVQARVRLVHSCAGGSSGLFLQKWHYGWREDWRLRSAWAQQAWSRCRRAVFLGETKLWAEIKLDCMNRRGWKSAIILLELNPDVLFLRTPAMLSLEPTLNILKLLKLVFDAFAVPQNWFWNHCASELGRRRRWCIRRDSSTWATIPRKIRLLCSTWGATPPPKCLPKNLWKRAQQVILCAPVVCMRVLANQARFAWHGHAIRTVKRGTPIVLVLMVQNTSLSLAEALLSGAFAKWGKALLKNPIIITSLPARPDYYGEILEWASTPTV